jgi:methionyl aminopeptidase
VARQKRLYKGLTSKEVDLVILKNKEEIKRIKESCYIVADVLDELKAAIKPGVTTSSLDYFAKELTRLHRATPGFLGYKGYPYTICASINDAVVHGFPSDYPLQEGDIITIDYGALYRGWYGDAAFTVGVGKISPEAEELILISKECLNKGIEKAIPGGRVGDISNSIQTHAEAAGFNPIRAYVGHGIGRELHELPKIPNYGKAKEGIMLKEGMVLAIEPIIAAGHYDIKHDDNNWTARTKDGSLVSQFEHTITITNNGPVILTKK